MTTRRAPEWSGVEDIRRDLERRWRSGDLLRWVAAGTWWEPIRVPVRGPAAREVSERFGEVQDWASALTAAAEPPGRERFRLELRDVGGRLVGMNAVPAAAWFDRPDQVWSLLRVGPEVQAFGDLLAAARDRDEALGDWVAEAPMKVLRRRAEWPRIVETVLWLRHNLGTGRYLRQIDVPGVDTKFIEAHQVILAELVDHLEPEAADRSRSAATEFARRYGFARKPRLIRLRSLDGRPVFGPMTDAVVRVEQLAAAELPVDDVVVVENEVTFLALPDIQRAVAVFGSGFDVLRLPQVQWLRRRRVTYWGDIDTHGYVILDRLRGGLPHVESVLMDLTTLLSHRSQWTREPQPSRVPLERLSPGELAVYEALVTDELGPAVRLEQERVNFAAVRAALASLGESAPRRAPG